MEEQRARILAAAIRTFAERDFHGTSIEAVAREAGVARPLVYELFGSKDALFDAVVDDAVSQFIEVMTSSYLDVATVGVRALVRDRVRMFFDFIAARPEVAAIVRIAESGSGDRVRHEVMAGRRRIEDGLAERYVEDWRPSGAVSPEAARVLAAVTMALTEAVGFRQTSEPRWNRDATIELLTEFIMGGFIRLSLDGSRLADFGVPAGDG